MVVFDGSQLIQYFTEGTRDGLFVGLVIWFAGLCINYIIKTFFHLSK